MVRIAIAGGSGQVAREVIDVLLSTNRHRITILSRNIVSTKEVLSGVDWQVVDYNDQTNLVKALRATHTLLSFLQPLTDPEGTIQKNLIDAAIVAGVKRFAPSEFSSASTVNQPWWTGKERTKEYLKQINQTEKVLEWILFQPGLFLDYLAYPHKTAKYIDPLQSLFDYQNCRAIMVDGHEDAVMTLTTAADVAAIVVRAVEYKGVWPEIGGISGNRVTFAEVVRIGEKIRGRPFTVDKVKKKDLESGILNTSWALEKSHQAVSEDRQTEMVKMVSIGILLSSVNGAWDVSNNLNQLFPDYRFESVEAFLTKVWGRKP